MAIAGWPYSELIEKIFLPYFQKHGEDSIKFLVEGQISSRAFLSAYRKLSPIEEMPEKEKREMKEYIRAMFPDSTHEEKLDACKIVYAIGTLA